MKQGQGQKYLVGILTVVAVFASGSAALAYRQNRAIQREVSSLKVESEEAQTAPYLKDVVESFIEKVQTRTLFSSAKSEAAARKRAPKLTSYDQDYLELCAKLDLKRVERNQRSCNASRKNSCYNATTCNQIKRDIAAFKSAFVAKHKTYPGCPEPNKDLSPNELKAKYPPANLRGILPAVFVCETQSSCTPDPARCNAATPACGQKTTGTDNCGSCEKRGAACPAGDDIKPQGPAPVVGSIGRPSDEGSGLDYLPNWHSMIIRGSGFNVDTNYLLLTDTTTNRKYYAAVQKAPATYSGNPDLILSFTVPQFYSTACVGSGATFACPNPGQRLPANRAYTVQVINQNGVSSEASAPRIRIVDSL